MCELDVSLYEPASSSERYHESSVILTGCHGAAALQRFEERLQEVLLSKLWFLLHYGERRPGGNSLELPGGQFVFEVQQFYNLAIESAYRDKHVFHIQVRCFRKCQITFFNLSNLNAERQFLLITIISINITCFCTWELNKAFICFDV